MLGPAVMKENRSVWQRYFPRVFGTGMGILVVAMIPELFAVEEYPGAEWIRATPEAMGMDAAKLAEARRYAETGGGAGCVIRAGRLVAEWGDPKRKYDLKSSSKGIGVTALGLALMDGVVELDDPAVKYHPDFGVPPQSNAETGWLPRITLRHLATQTAGFQKPGGYTPLLFEPGTHWDYSDSGPNWLAECLTLAYGRDMESLLFDRVFSRLGITPDDLYWRPNAYRPHEINGLKRCEFGSGVHANVDAMARIGYLYLRGGVWQGTRILPLDFVHAVGRPDLRVRGLPMYAPDQNNAAGQSPRHYGLLWWNNADGTLPKVPSNTFWTWGLHESLIIVIPDLDMVMARAGRDWKREPGGRHYDVLAPFMNPLVEAVVSAPRYPNAPYPPSRELVNTRWQDASQILRLAPGSDNWPMTWGDDGAQYTAYGDGWGFVPKVEDKLSLGFARVFGNPPKIAGENIRTPTGEQSGQGAAGKKASGILMVDGVLYLLARNADNAQLAWSSNHGRTWQWSPWKFTTSFGCPTFLNFGKNYAGARDDFAYIYSHDNSSAYRRADRMVLARVPKANISDRSAYQFFTGLTAEGNPEWSIDIADRGAVFSHANRCYRNGITYNPGLERYLWCQILGGSSPNPPGNERNDTRFAGGFGIYDAPEPWGPWTTVFFTEQWDVGPGESSRLPVKWMAPDGSTCHLVFSGNDHFSVRQVHFTQATPP